MNAVLALAPRFQRAGGRDARVTTGLAVTAFAVTTGLTLSVVGGLLGFMGRAAQPRPGRSGRRPQPLRDPRLDRGGAARRAPGVARRRRGPSRASPVATPAWPPCGSSGATPREVVGLTVAETAWQGLVGAVLGIVLYVALLPVCALLPFQGTTFSVAELWVGLAGARGRARRGAAAGRAVRRVLAAPRDASPRSASRGGRPRRSMTWLRLVVARRRRSGSSWWSASPAGRWVRRPSACSSGRWPSRFATLNAVGPWVARPRRQGAAATRDDARPAARRAPPARRPEGRVARGRRARARRVRRRGAVGPAVDHRIDTAADPEGAILLDDLVTGAMVTLVVAFLLAAVSAGIAQAAGVLDRRREIALQNLAGIPGRAARLRAPARRCWCRCCSSPWGPP